MHSIEIKFVSREGTKGLIAFSTENSEMYFIEELLVLVLR